MSDLASSKSILRESGSGGEPSVYDHLSQLLLKLIKEKPAEPIKEFEALSVRLKQQRLRSSAGAASASAAASSGAGIVGLDYPAPALVTEDNNKKAVQAFLQSTQDLLKKPKKFNEDGEEEEEDEPEMNPAAPDLIEQAALLKEAGISLRPFELQRLNISVQTLCNTNDTFESPRFWGKVLGTHRDYYIIEGKIGEDAYPEDEEAEEAAAAAAAAEKPEPEEGEEEEEEQEPPASRVEPWGIGANEYVYYASNSVDGPWTRLPKVTPEQIIAARGMRRFLTGDLKAPVFGFPRFPWGEGSLLRTQIARITAGTYLVPRGSFLGDEEEPLIAVENEEFKGVRASTLLDGNNWLHLRPKLLGEGRVEAFVDENAEDEPDDDELDELEREKRAMERAKKEKPVAVLTPASRDQIINPKTGAPRKRHLWKFHLSNHSDTGLLPRAPPPAGVDPDDLPPDNASSHVIASAHSLLWPGAVSIAQNKTLLHVYAGYGLKELNKGYKPVGPAVFQSEYKPPQVPNKKGVIVNPIQEQSDEMPPPPDKDPRSEEEKEAEAEEEKERLARKLADESEPVEELEDEEEEKAPADEDDE